MKKNLSDDPILKFLFRRVDFEHDCEPLSPGCYEVELQLVPIVCWKCHQALAAVAEVVLYAFDLLMFRGKDVRLWPLEEGRSPFV